MTISERSFIKATTFQKIELCKKKFTKLSFGFSFQFEIEGQRINVRVKVNHSIRLVLN